MFPTKWQSQTAWTCKYTCHFYDPMPIGRGTLHLFHTRLTSYDNCTSRPMHPSDKQHTHKTHTGISEMCQKMFNKAVLLCHTVRCATACQGVSQLLKSADSARALRTRSYFHLSPLQSACGTSVCQFFKCNHCLCPL